MAESNNQIIISSQGLRKTFPARRGNSIVEAVKGIDLEVKKGEIFGLLGPNGAGKSTTMRMLCTLLKPTEGTITIDGCDMATQPNQVRARIGYVSQKGGMDPAATGRENLVLQGLLYGMNHTQAAERTAKLIGLLHLDLFADRKTRTYSGGQRRIFDLCSSIIHEPSILFLDEPTTGLDPQSRSFVWGQIKHLNEQGTTVFLTTHYLEEADSLCNRVAIVDHGTVIVCDSPAVLKYELAGDIIILGMSDLNDGEKAVQLLANHNAIKEMKIIDAMVYVYLKRESGREKLLPEIMKLLTQNNLSIASVQFSRPTLDDVFLKLTGRTMRDSEVTE